jgi:cytochrome oxidase Cu insertion factor (SCO1/SenC/PrrC family)
MKLPLLIKDFENKWVAMTSKPDTVVASARSYKALNRKLKKDQKDQVVLLKVPRFDQNFP